MAQSISKTFLRIAEHGEEFARLQLKIADRKGSLTDTITMQDLAALNLAHARIKRALEDLFSTVKTIH